MSEIKPALPEWEWAEKHHYVQCYDSWDEFAAKTGVGEIKAGPDSLRLTSHQHQEFADFSAPTDRHAIAALALHEQPFGFTWEDVDSCRAQAEEFESYHDSDLDLGSYENMLYWQDLADRIAALLPPREDKT